MCVCVRACVYEDIYIYLCVYIYIRIYVYIVAPMHSVCLSRVYVCLSVCVCVYIRNPNIYARACRSTGMHTQTRPTDNVSLGCLVHADVQCRQLYINIVYSSCCFRI